MEIQDTEVRGRHRVTAEDVLHRRASVVDVLRPVSVVAAGVLRLAAMVAELRAAVVDHLMAVDRLTAADLPMVAAAATDTAKNIAGTS